MKETEVTQAQWRSVIGRISDLSGDDRPVDWYGHYPTSRQTDPRGPSGGSDRVLRGGGWILGAWFNVRSASRDKMPPNMTMGYGFRPVRSVSTR